jgi:protein-disulfide isomerase
VLKEHPGKVRLVHKDLPLARHELARAAHSAARCAGAHGRYWAYHDRLYAEQPAFEHVKLIRYAVELGIEAAPFTRCLDGDLYAGKIDADLEEARRLGIRATPTFIINGRRLVGAQPIEAFRQAIEDALRERTGR